MKLTKGFLYILLFPSIFLIQNADAQINVSASVEAVSKYVWRGFNLADKPTIQPNLDIEFANSGFALNVWNSMALVDRDVYSAADELDFTATYSPSLENVGLTLGFIFYIFDFKPGDNNTKEVFASVSPVNMPLSPELTLFYDFDAGDGLYATLGAGHSVPLNSHSLDFGVAVGYNGGQWGTDSGLSHVDFSVSTSFSAGQYSLSPRAVFVIVMEKSVNSDNEFFFGFSVSR